MNDQQMGHGELPTDSSGFGAGVACLGALVTLLLALAVLAWAVYRVLTSDA